MEHIKRPHILAKSLLRDWSRIEVGGVAIGDRKGGQTPVIYGLLPLACP